MITGLVGTVFDTDEPPFVSISADVMLNGEEHCVNIYWYPETDEVFVRGSVVISGTLGPFLKVNDGYWVRTAPAVPKKLWSDLDLVNELINEYEDNEYIATVIDPGLE